MKKYPRFNNHCEMTKVDDMVLVTNHYTEDECSIPIEWANWCYKLDGKRNPYRIDRSLSRDEVNYRLEQLKKLECIRYGRLIKGELGTRLISLYMPRRISANTRVFAWIYNKALQFFFVPILIIGICMFIFELPDLNGDIWLGSIFGLIVGLLVHELSHALATLSCKNGKFFEFGIGISYYVLPMAYVLIDKANVKSKFQKVQILLAGIESNIALCGIFLIVSCLCPSNLVGVFFAAGVQNLFLALLNSIMVGSLDGGAIIAELIGSNVGDFLVDSIDVVLLESKRKFILRSGINGYAKIVGSFLFILIQLSLVVILLWNIVEIFEVVI